MRYNFGHYFDQLQPHFTKVMAGNPYLNYIRTWGPQLPALPFGAFEYGLGASQERFDLNICIAASRNEHRIAARWIGKPAQLQGEAKSWVPYSLAAFLDSWTAEKFPLHPFISALWLVLDVENPHKTAVLPWYYISFSSIAFNTDPAFKSEVIIRTLFYTKKNIAELFLQKLRAFFKSLPSSVLVKSIGTRSSTNVDAMKVYLVMKKYNELLHFLKQHRWPGDLDVLHKKINVFTAGSQLFGLGITLTPVLQPKIGIEFWYDSEKTPRALQNAMACLVADGYSTERQMQSFIDWEGEFLIPAESSIWPQPGSGDVRIRKISRYIKIIYDADNIISAKVYFGFHRAAFL